MRQWVGFVVTIQMPDLRQAELKAQKLVGLHREAVKVFHGFIPKHLVTEYTEADYGSVPDRLFQCSTQELFKMGRAFRLWC